MTAAETFFLRTLPRLICDDLSRWSSLRGTLAFSCAGQTFTVRLGDLVSPVELGFDRQADLRLFFASDAFDRFLEGSAPRLGAHLRLQGDAEVLARFGAFLQPPKTALSIQL